MCTQAHLDVAVDDAQAVQRRHRLHHINEEFSRTALGVACLNQLDHIAIAQLIEGERESVSVCAYVYKYMFVRCTSYCSMSFASYTYI